MKSAWAKLRSGDHLTDDELDAMIKQAEAAKVYLADRLPEFYLAWKETVMDLNRMHDWRASRKRQAKDRQAV